MKLKMKNLKVFAEVKKICTIFCLFTGGREIEFYVAFLKKLICFFCLVMGRAGQGPPNMYIDY